MIQGVAGSALLVVHAPAPTRAKGEAFGECRAELYDDRGINILNEDFLTQFVHHDERLRVAVLVDRDRGDGSADGDHRLRVYDIVTTDSPSVLPSQLCGGLCLIKVRVASARAPFTEVEHAADLIVSESFLAQTLDESSVHDGDAAHDHRV